MTNKDQMAKARIVDQFNDVVQSMVVSWSSSPKKSLNQLATLSGIRRGTVYKLLSGEAKASNLHPTRILDLLAILETKENRTTLKTKYKDALSEIFKEDIAPLIDEELSSNAKFIEQFVDALQDQVALTIYSLALRTNGVSMQEVRDEYGQNGLKVLAKLTENEILLNSAYQTYVPANKYMIRLERAHIQKLIPHMNELYKTQNANQQRNFISMRIDSINAEALKEVYDLHADFEEKIKEILAASSSKGDIPFYSFSQLETLIKDIK